MMCYAYAFADSSGVSINMFRTEEERDQAVYDLLADDYDGAEEEIPFGKPGQDDAETMWVKYCADMKPDYNLAFGNM